MEQTTKLLDSIIKGYPIGTFILWKTRERLGEVKNIGNMKFPETPAGDSVKYVLDGQQRLASLFAVLEGLEIEKENKIVNYKNIFLNLDKEINNDEQIITAEKPVGNNCISVYDLLSKEDISYFLDNYRDYINKIQNYREKFRTYDFSTIEILDYPIDTAVEIFTRINTTGTELTLFEIMVAKTYDEARGFDLHEKYEQLDDELSNIKYDTIPSSTILQCLSLNLTGECTRRVILKLNKEDIINIWDETIKGIKEAIDYFRTLYRIPVSRLLPYNALIVPFSYFFFKNKDRPNSEQEELLKEYFWCSSLTYRFQSAVETKLGQDAKSIDMILNNKKPKYDFKPMLDTEVIKNYGFNAGDSFCKAILCLYAQFKPESFKNGSAVILDNSWLIQSNSRNYHHFFPKAYLKKQKIENENSIINITLVDDYLNKREIRAKAPSEYLKKFKETNKKLDSTMETHLIDNLGEYGVWEDNYDKFLDKRTERVTEELRKRIG